MVATRMAKQEQEQQLQMAADSPRPSILGIWCMRPFSSAFLRISSASCRVICRALPVRMIPVPEEITAGCGMAWRAGPGDRETLLAALRGAGLGSGPERMVEMYG